MDNANIKIVNPNSILRVYDINVRGKTIEPCFGTLLQRYDSVLVTYDGIFGGLPRKMTIESIDDSEIIAMVKLSLESSENYFISYNSLVLDIDNEWKIINNLAVVEQKK